MIRLLILDSKKKAQTVGDPMAGQIELCVKFILIIGLLMANTSVGLKAEPLEGNREAKQLSIYVQAPESNPPNKDALRSINTGPNSPPGLLVYATFGAVPGEKVIQHFLILRSTGARSTGAKIQGGMKAVASYRIMPRKRSSDWTSLPQFSPDGRYVLFKYGWPFDYPYTYRIYLLNLKTQQLQGGPPEYLNSAAPARWSPDGNAFAYYVGGAEGGTGQLRIFDAVAGRARTVTQMHVNSDAVWTPQNTLLFSAQDPQTNVYNIYEATRAKNPPHLLIENAQRPRPAPDGQQILYSGPPFDPPEKPEDKTPTTEIKKKPPAPLGLTEGSLYNRDLKSGVRIDLGVRDISSRMWLPDSKRLVILRRDRNGDPYKRFVGVFDIASQTLKEVATLQMEGIFVEEKDGLPPAPLPPVPDGRHRTYQVRFETLRVSRDGKFLIILQTEVSDIQPNGALRDGYSYLKAVNLHDGTVTNLASTKNSNGLDWIEAPP